MLALYREMRQNSQPPLLGLPPPTTSLHMIIPSWIQMSRNNSAPVEAQFWLVQSMTRVIINWNMKRNPQERSINIAARRKESSKLHVYRDFVGRTRIRGSIFTRFEAKRPASLSLKVSRRRRTPSAVLYISDRNRWKKTHQASMFSLEHCVS